MLKNYFEDVTGTGVLATADASGKVNAALYGKPHSIEGDTVAFIMADRLSRRNLESNPSACYLFRETGTGYRGKRLYLTKTGEESDQETIAALRRRTHHDDQNDGQEGTSRLVYFRVDRVLPLVGSGPEPE
ncbi:MAG: pyridoxamine 5'-phosphate oxidase [delta proteobacterium MLS_D]|jgi:hypothetical protein|nr:MAG: pyridoxamine 5'-phosphate oxidase [delta proteobacterium MLS_D]